MPVRATVEVRPDAVVPPAAIGLSPAAYGVTAGPDRVRAPFRG
ncbi:hypothetical protein MPTA5024_06835 [Microbispora sp. ATCC PTA-5024]|nr:hypothetical protein MPTA5024_06835 [Microbispora sp. ATCC PTA-5024]